MAWDKKAAAKMDSEGLGRALRAAAARGDAESVRGLLALGADLDARAPGDEDAVLSEPSSSGGERKIVRGIRRGDDALLTCARIGELEAFEMLREARLKKGGAAARLFELVSADGEDAAMAAASSSAPGSADVLARLLELDRGWACNRIGPGPSGSAYRRAAVAGNAVAMRMISRAIEQGHGRPAAVLEAEAVDERGRTPLMWALASGGEVAAREAFEFATREGMGRRDDGGRGLWMCAAEGGAWQSVELVSSWRESWVGRGPFDELGRRDAGGACALDVASALGALDACRALWKAARSEMPEAELRSQWESAFKAATFGGKAHVAQWLREAEGKMGRVAPPERGQGLAAAAAAALDKLREASKGIKPTPGPGPKKGRG